MKTNHLATSPWRPGDHDARAMIPATRAMTGYGAVSGTSADQLDALVRDLLDSPYSSPSRNQGGLTPKQQVDSYQKHWIYVAVRAIRDGICQAVLQHWSNPEDPKEVLDPDDELVFLFDHPNPLDTSIEFWSQIAIYLELCGNAPILKVRDGFGVAELWPIPPQWLTPIHLPNRPMVGYAFDGQTGKPRFIPAEDVIPLKYVNPGDRFWGLGTLAAAAASAKSHDKITLSQALSFEEEILQDLVFTTDKTLGPGMFERTREMLLERYGGVEKKGLPLLFENGMKAEYLRRAPAEMAFMESSKMTRDQMLAIYGVQPIVAGIVDNANRSNSESQIWLFQGQTIFPRLKLIHKKFNRDPELFPPERKRYVEFANPVPKDKEHELKKAVQGVASGTLAPNDARVELGLDPTEWGERPRWVWELCLKEGLEDLTPATVAEVAKRKREMADKAAEALAQVGQNGPPKPGEPGNGPPNGGPPKPPKDPDDVDDDATKKSVGTGVASPLGVMRRESPSREQQLVNLRARIDADHDRLEAGAHKTLRKFFAQQMDRILKNVDVVFANLPEDDDGRTEAVVVPARAIRAVFDNHGARMYPDGSKRQFAFHGDEPAELGETVVDGGCCENTGEVRTILIRSIDPGQMDGLDDWLRASDELAKRMEPHLRSSLQAGGNMQLDQFAMPGRFDLNNPTAERWLEQKNRDYWNGSVAATTRSQLGQKMAEVMNGGPTRKKLRDAVKEVFVGDPKGRSKAAGGRFASADTIARTEVNGAYNGGAQMVRDELGVSSKEWIATHDNRTRNSHWLADGQIRKNAEPFQVGNARLMYPGDPAGPVNEIANCRCCSAAIPSTDDDLVPGLTVPGKTADNPPGMDVGVKDKSSATGADDVTAPYVPPGMTFSKKSIDTTDPLQKLGNEIRTLAGKARAGGTVDVKDIRSVGRKASAHLDGKLDADAKTLEGARQDWIRARERYEREGFEMTVPFEKRKELYDQVIANRQAHDLIQEVTRKKYEEHVNEVLKNVRDFGTAESIPVTPVGKSGKKLSADNEVAKTVKAAAQRLPTDWLKKIFGDDFKKEYFAEHVNRGFFSRYEKKIAVSGAGRAAEKTGVHELTHAAEAAIPELVAAERQLYADRCDPSRVRATTRKGYKRAERFREDKWTDVYVGKDYSPNLNGQADYFEILTMGLQEILMGDGLRLYTNDRDHHDFCMGALLSL